MNNGNMGGGMKKPPKPTVKEKPASGGKGMGGKKLYWDGKKWC